MVYQPGDLLGSFRYERRFLVFKLLEHVDHIKDLPLIIKGGFGNADHIIAGLSDNRVDAVATANLLNYVGNGLARARELAISGGINLPKF